MYEILIDDLHRLLEDTEEVIEEIAAYPEQTIDVGDLPELCGVILEVLGWTNTAYIENTLGINPALLGKFVKMRGKVRKIDAAKVADRLRSYLRSEDQALIEPEEETAPTPPRSPDPPKKTTLSNFSITGGQWVAVQQTSAMKAKIGAVASLLDGIIEQASRPNAPPAERALTEIERCQLIAVLETALNVLRSPLVEKGILKEAKQLLLEGAAAAVRTGYQEALGIIMHQAGDRLGELIGLLFK